MLACTSRAALCTLSQKAGTPFRTFRILLLACFCFRSGGGVELATIIGALTGWVHRMCAQQMKALQRSSCEPWTKASAQVQLRKSQWPKLKTCFGVQLRKSQQG